MQRSARLVIVLALLIGSSSAFARTWTDRQGMQITGKYVRVYQGNVVILRAGRSMTVPLSQLCDEDQEYVNEQIESRKRDRIPSVIEPTVPEEPADADTEDLQPIARQWTDVRGNRITAKFWRVKDDQIVLIHGSELDSYPFVGFCKADQDYLREILESRGETEALATLNQAVETQERLAVRSIHRIPSRSSAPSVRRPEIDRPTSPRFNPPPSPRYQPRSPSPSVSPPPSIPKSSPRPETSTQTPGSSPNPQSSFWSPKRGFLPSTEETKPALTAVVVIKLLFFLFIGTLIGTLVGAVVLRISCWIFNKLAGGPNARSAIPQPEFDQAMSISFMFCAIGLLEYFLILAMFFIGFTHEILWVCAISPVANFFLMSGLVGSQLPTSYVKGMVVVLIDIIVSVCLAFLLICPFSIIISLLSTAI